MGICTRALRDGLRHGGLGRHRGVRRRERQRAEPVRQDAVVGRKASKRVCICHGKGGRGRCLVGLGREWRCGWMGSETL